VITEANAINESGQIIGTAQSAAGEIRAVLLTPASCYANCDGSTAAPALNVADFSCFLNRFAAGDPYANCDQSTAAPVLNIADFSCFLNQFAAGCPE
jgi:probable HAF family extracellular repeat protein